MPYGYSIKKLDENMVKASARNINISPKQAIEICNYVRGRSLAQAKRLLLQAMDMKTPIPLKRFTNGPGHKPGIASGRFYVKSCGEILKALESAESNAKNKGLTVSKLSLAHLAVQRAPKSWHYGRKRRSLFRTVHIEVALVESDDKSLSKKGSSGSKKDNGRDENKAQAASSKSSAKKSIATKKSVENKKSTDDKKSVDDKNTHREE